MSICVIGRASLSFSATLFALLHRPCLLRHPDATKGKEVYRALKCAMRHKIN
jgi:hypothetical protein